MLTSVVTGMSSNPVLVNRQARDVGEKVDEISTELTDSGCGFAEHSTNLLLLVDEINGAVRVRRILPISDADEEVKIAFHRALKIEKKWKEDSNLCKFESWSTHREVCSLSSAKQASRGFHLEGNSGLGGGQVCTQLLGDFDRTSDAEAKVWAAGGVGVGDVLAEVEDCGAGGAAQREAEQKGGRGEDGRVVVGVRHRQKDSGKRLVVGVVRNGGRIREKEKAATGWVPPLENRCQEKK